MAAMTGDPAPGRIISLQVLRFAAASCVIALHAWQVVSGVPNGQNVGVIGTFGPFGVDVFFVLSGFIIATTAPGRASGLFLKQRAIRIVPLYWLLTLVMMALLARAGMLTARPLLASALFIPTLHAEPYIVVGWTLCYEMLFYGAVAAVLLRPRWGWMAMLGLYAAASLARPMVGGPLLQFIGSPLIAEFLAGVLIARAPRSALAGWLAGVAGVVALGVLALSGYQGVATRPEFAGSGDWQRVMVYGCPAALLVYAAVHLDLRGRLWRALAYLGDASYAAYLVHVLVLVLVPLSLMGHAQGPAAAMLFGLSWLAAIALHERLEKPMQTALKRALLQKPRGEEIGAPGTIRTSDPQIRSLMLYPAELRARRALRQGRGT
jgi:exopolysaccharide production protein ExoZ